MDSGRSCLVPRPGRLLFPAIAILAVLAWLNRFIQDDAFISFRYARNFVRGLGLVWNPGERVEGYTNFLWTILMAIPHKLGIDPIGFSYAIGIASFCSSLYVTYRVAKLVLGSEGPALLAAILLGTNYTFIAFATGGLETQLQAFLFVLAVLLYLHLRVAGATSARAAVLSLVLGLAVLTRPDSILLVVLLVPLTLRQIRRKRDGRARALFASTLPFAALVAPWLAWKLAFYGNLLPNTFYAKSPDAVSLLRGLYYFAVFAGMYWLFVLLPWAIRAGRRLLRQREPRLLVLAAATLLWFAYVLVFGGDFMQFRMLVPVMPFLFILVAWTLCSVVRSRMLRAGLVVVVLAGSVFCAVFHGRGIFAREPGSIRRLAEHVTYPSENWAGIGRALGRAFDRDSSVLIATTAAGAIPYYSGLRAIDMLGLNDPWVARHGRRLTSHAGHRRIATLDYLMGRHVSLVVGHPPMVNSDAAAATVRFDRVIQRLEPGECAPEDAQFVEIPIDHGYRLVALYLVRSSVVDSVIAREGWRTWPVPSDGGPR